VSRDVAEYNGIKYSLQPHGLRSKLWVAFAFFVVAFGGALAIMSPASANPTDPPGQCYVAVPDPSQPSPTPSPPLTIPSPTACPTAPPPVTVTTTITVASPSPSPVLTTVTKQVTIYVDKTTTRTETVTITPSPSAAPTSKAGTTALPSRTPDPPVLKLASNEGSLVVWGVITVGVVGAFLALLGFLGIVRNRRQQPPGRHAVDNSETTMIPVVRSSKDDHSVDDYADGEYDPALGGYAGESFDETREMPALDTDTKPMPPVE
jgi:hypothetical protein